MIARAAAWQWGRLSDLAVGDLYAVMAARQQVFVVEQRCAYLDADGLDPHAWHLLGWDRGRGGPAARVLPARRRPGSQVSRAVDRPRAHRARPIAARGSAEC